MKKISVIIPVYNTEKYLRRCLDSVVQQSLKEIEIIIVNDCSPDNSLEIIQEYMQSDERILLINKEINQGLSAARNSGIAQAQAEYILHIDSDDWVEQNYFHDIFNYAKTYDADMVITDFYTDYDNGQLKLTTDQQIHNNQELSKVSCIENICQFKAKPVIWNKLIRRALYQENHILHPVGISMGEDLYVTPKLMYFANKIVKYSHAYYHYIQNQASMMKMATTNSNKLRDINLVVNNLAEFFKEKDIAVSIDSLKLSHLSIWMFKTRYDFKNQEYNEVYRNYINCIKETQEQPTLTNVLKYYLAILKKLPNRLAFVSLWQVNQLAIRIKKYIK